MFVNVEDMAQLVWKKKSVHHGEPLVVDAPMDVDVAAFDALSEGNLIARAGMTHGRETEAQVYSRSSSSRATGVINVVG